MLGPSLRMRKKSRVPLGFEHEFELEMSPELFGGVIWESIVALTDHFTVALFAKALSAAITCQCYEAQKFEPDAILFGTAECKKNDILMF